MNINLGKDDTLILIADQGTRLIAKSLGPANKIAITARTNLGTDVDVSEDITRKAEHSRFYYGFRQPVDGGELMVTTRFGINPEMPLVEKAETVVAVSTQQRVKVIKIRDVRFALDVFLEPSEGLHIRHIELPINTNDALKQLDMELHTIDAGLQNVYAMECVPIDPSLTSDEYRLFVPRFDPTGESRIRTAIIVRAISDREVVSTVTQPLRAFLDITQDASQADFVRIADRYLEPDARTLAVVVDADKNNLAMVALAASMRITNALYSHEAQALLETAKELMRLDSLIGRIEE